MFSTIQEPHLQPLLWTTIMHATYSSPSPWLLEFEVSSSCIPFLCVEICVIAGVAAISMISIPQHPPLNSNTYFVAMVMPRVFS